MNPLRLRIQNLGVLRDVDIDLPEGLVGILGEIQNAPASIDSNGSGKTTLVQSIVACLFGPSGRSFADDLTRGEDRMEIELTFEQDFTRYRVRRTFTVKGGAKLDLEVYDKAPGPDSLDRGWQPLTRESIDATQALINATVGFTKTTFLDSVFLSQEDGSFADGKASEVKQLLTEAAFGLEPSWPVYAARANTERKAFDVELQQVEGRTQAARELVETKPELDREHEAATENETVLADAVADREREHVALAEQWQAAREQAAKRQAAEAELREAQHAVDVLEERGKAADAAARQIVEATAALEQLPAAADVDALDGQRVTLEEKRAEYREQATLRAQAQTERDRCERELTEARTTAGALNGQASAIRTTITQKRADENATCHACEQPIVDEAKEKSLADLERTAVECEAKAASCDFKAQKLAVLVAEGDALLAVAAAVQPPDETEYASVVAQIAAARAAQTQRATLAERIRQSENTAAAGPSPDDANAANFARLQKQVAVDALAPVDVAAIEAQGKVAKFALDNSKIALQNARSLVARLDERRVQMAAAEQALAEASTRTADLHRQIDTRVRLEKACGLNGVPALILETAVIPFMEAQAAEALAALGTPWQIEIRTQRAKKDGDLTDSCEVVVLTETGESPFRKLSGGEQVRIGILLRVALSALMPGRSGIFVIDEPRWLDAAGIEALIESLRGLLGRYSRVYVVTQSGTALRDSFDEVLVVTKNGGASHVTSGYAVEAEVVAA